MPQEGGMLGWGTKMAWNVPQVRGLLGWGTKVVRNVPQEGGMLGWGTKEVRNVPQVRGIFGWGASRAGFGGCGCSEFVGKRRVVGYFGNCKVIRQIFCKFTWF